MSKPVFVCQITESSLKLVKCLAVKQERLQVTGLYTQGLSALAGDADLAKEISQAFKNLGYNDNAVIVSLPRLQATCRYAKIPAKDKSEIEKIVSLQASQYLPYPADELISAYEVIRVDESGYSHVNQTIAHKDIIERYIKLFSLAKPGKLILALSSYGLCNLYNYLADRQALPAVLIDLDYNQAELAVIHNQKLTFSRSFKFSADPAQQVNLLTAEINKTMDAFRKEINQEFPAKAFITGAGKGLEKTAEALSRQINLPVEILSFVKKIDFSAGLTDKIVELPFSFASLFGLAAKTPEESLNLLPVSLKEELRRSSRNKERLRNILVMGVIVGMFCVAAAKDLDNRRKYLGRLEEELGKIVKEAKPLEDMDKRLELLDARARKKASSLDLLRGLSQLMPQDINLTDFNYEEDNQVVLRGQAGQLNSVFSFAAALEKDKNFTGFNIKVKYATKRKTTAGETVDFEIVLKNA